MIYESIIITGTRCAGKSTLVNYFLGNYDMFSLVKAVTTRPSRNDKEKDNYNFVTEDEFGEKKLFVDIKYHEYSYGIEETEIKKIISAGKVPVMIISPEALKILTSRDDKNLHLSFFIDADDRELNERLKKRELTSDQLEQEIIQRKIDRKFAYKSIYRLKNSGPKFDPELSNLLHLLWGYRKSGGMIHRKLISSLTKFGALLKNATEENISNSSYDLSLGDEYYYKGKIENLSDKDPFILIEPYDYAIVTSKEIANFPNDISGRFDLKVSLFCQGVILSNGTQVDPGFEGKLFCLLFNTSNSPVVLKRGQHYSTIEFNKLIAATDGYEGIYQSKIGIINYLPTNTLQGGVNELKKEIEKLKTESTKLQTMILGIISLLLGLIAIYRVMG